MSGLGDIAQQMTALRNNTQQAIAQLNVFSSRSRQANAMVQQIMRTSSGASYTELISQLNSAEKSIRVASDSLLLASNTAERWLATHIVSGNINNTSGISGNAGYSLDVSEEKTPFERLSDYMVLNNFGINDYEEYSKDPQWRVLHREAFPENDIPPLPQQDAYALLQNYMSQHNYGIADYGTYSQDPVWQELHKFAFPGDNVGTVDFSAQHDAIVRSLIDRGVDQRKIHPFGRIRTSEEIVERLSGGDLTDGSCSSLAFAYAGNRAGFDVLDFRDGDSRRFFSSNASIQKIADIPGVKSEVLYGTNDIDCSNRLFNKMLSGKEYYFATGEHAAIIRKGDKGIEYLELQHPYDGNGWHSLSDSTLIDRFGCSYSNSYELPNFLIEVNSLANSAEFLDILSFINTSEAQQRKGATGYER